jgi:hypothetical protein
MRKRIKRFFKGPPPPQPDTRIAVWQDHKLLYVRVPKCGNTSIMNAIDGVEKRRMWAADILSLPDDWTTFSFVRNPWARIVSTFRDKASPDSKSKRMVDGVFAGFLEAGLAVKTDMSFAEFCEVVCDVPDEKTDKHLRSQASFLIRDGQPIVKTIGRVEDMETDWNVIMEKARLNFKLVHLNKTRGRHYSSYFDDQHLVNLVGDRYAEDIRFFNYDFTRIREAPA